MVEQMSFAPAPSCSTELIAICGKSAFLEALDPETEIGNTGRTAAEELKKTRHNNRNSANSCPGVN